MNKELELIANQLQKATKPEDVFGKIHNEDSLRRSYRSLAKLTHPDVYQTYEEKHLAQSTFGRLVQWFDQAIEKIRSGRYGRTEEVTLLTKTRKYEVGNGYTESRNFNIYPCHFYEDGQTHSATLRIVRDPRRNHISRNEIRILNILFNSREASIFSPYLPTLHDEFIYENGVTSHHAAIFEEAKGWYSLEDVHKSYPNGVDPKDMAWMWRRLLVALGFAHANSVIHGAVLPCNIWIQPEEHGLMLKNWFYSVHDPATSGETVPDTEPAYVPWYPQEILKFETPTFGSDICMSARCMIQLLGGDAEKGTIPDWIPNPIRMFLRGSILPGRRTPQDAWALKQEFDDLLKRLWGKRTFHPFKMNFTH